MAITDAIRDRIRRYIGDTATPSTFSDAEIDTIYSDNDEDLESTIVECFDALLADRAKQVSYRQGGSFEDLSKMFEHVQKLRNMWADRAGIGKGQITTGALTFSFYDDSTAGQDIPYDADGDDDYGWILE